jgi:hypothetical protein
MRLWRRIGRRRARRGELVARVLSCAGAVTPREIAAEIGRLDDELLELDAAAARAQRKLSALVAELRARDPVLGAALTELEQSGDLGRAS